MSQPMWPWFVTRSPSFVASRQLHWPPQALNWLINSLDWSSRLLLNPKVSIQPSLRDMSERRPTMVTTTPPTAQVSDTGENKVDVGHLLEPVRMGLQRVEKKMKAVDSAIFAPLAGAFVDL